MLISHRKKLMLTTLITMVIILGVAISNTALAASTTKKLSTNFTLVNLSETDDAEVTVNYLTDKGKTWNVSPENIQFTIPKNYGQRQIRQYFDTMMPSDKGSAVVSSDQPLGAVVQIQARDQVPTSGAYSGFQKGYNKYYVPLAARNRVTASGTANSQIIVQNTSRGNINVDVALVNENGTTQYTKRISNLANGVTYYYDLADEKSSNVPNNWIGSAVVTALDGGEISVVSNFFTGPNAMQTFNAFPEESLGPRWIVPLFFSRLPNGLSTVVTVQNLSDGEIPRNAISLKCKRMEDFVGNMQFTKTNPAAIGPSGSYSFNPVTELGMFPQAGWGGSCEVDAGAYNVVVLAQLRYVGAGSNQGSAAYEAIPATTVGKKFVVPLMAKQLANGFATVVAIQNMNFASEATVTLTYMPFFNEMECPKAICDRNKDGVVNESDKIVVSNVKIPAGGSIQRNLRVSDGPQAQTQIPRGWQGSLLVTSNQNISGFVQLTNYLYPNGDTFMAHSGFVINP